jgi:NADH dehydrogenase
MTQRVVVIGGGFGGLAAVRKLKRADVDITLVDRQNFFLFQPLAYQVATGSLSSVEIAAPLRQVLRRQSNTRVLMAEAVGFDLDAKTVTVAELPNGEPQRDLPYDVLVVAAGARYSYFGHDDWAPHAPELKSLEGALDLRDRILRAFEAAELEQDDDARAAWLTFVVVGAGPTGVEMAGQIAELGREALRREYRDVDTRAVRVLLVEAGDRVLATFPPSLSAKGEAQLRSLGVTPMLRSTVVGITDDDVEVEARDGTRSRIPTRTAVWAAGVQASPLAASLAEAGGLETDRAGRLEVEPDLTLPGHPDVFALGDMVTVRGQALHGVAPVAMQQGRHVARSIASGESAPFRYRDKGELATIGRSRAVGVVKRFRFSGFPAWALWLGIHLTYLIGFENRLVVLTRWSFSYLTRGRNARVIHHGLPPGDRERSARDADRLGVGGGRQA